MNLYEFNQAGYSSLPKMTKVEIENKKEDIFRFLVQNVGSYFMLVCNELKYYTLFDNSHPGIALTSMVDTILDIVKGLGTLKAIEIQDSMIEFWVQNEGECHMYAFFNYDKGVVRL